MSSTKVYSDVSSDRSGKSSADLHLLRGGEHGVRSVDGDLEVSAEVKPKEQDEPVMVDLVDVSDVSMPDCDVSGRQATGSNRVFSLCSLDN